MFSIALDGNATEFNARNIPKRHLNFSLIAIIRCQFKKLELRVYDLLIVNIRATAAT